MARIDQPETYFRKSCWDTVGGVNIKYRYLMDRDLWIRYLLAYGLKGILKTNDYIVNFRLHSSSKTVSEGSHFESEADLLFESINHFLFHNKTNNFLYQNKSLEINFNKIINYRIFHKIQIFYFQNKYIDFDSEFKKISCSLLTFNEQLTLYNLIIRRYTLPVRIKEMYKNRIKYL